MLGKWLSHLVFAKHGRHPCHLLDTTTSALYDKAKQYPRMNTVLLCQDEYDKMLKLFTESSSSGELSTFLTNWTAGQPFSKLTSATEVNVPRFKLDLILGSQFQPYYDAAMLDPRNFGVRNFVFVRFRGAVMLEFEC